MELVFSLLQQLSVYLVLAYLLSKTPLFLPITTISARWSHRFLCYIIFSGFCILGTYFGLAIQDAIANTRAIGAVMGGVLGGPLVGFFVGLTGGYIVIPWAALPILPVQYQPQLKACLVVYFIFILLEKTKLNNYLDLEPY